MKLILLVVILLLGACKHAVSAAPLLQTLPGPEQQYADGIEDMPLYPGFYSSDDESVSYDTSAGRIISLNYFHSNASAKDVRNYYELTLPQLGWQKQQYQLYTRDGESLRITVLQQQQGVRLKMRLGPV
tara:strand:+ start:216 stop:602 length:387 start_codon:yes stop_codon:yes gene_type:complete